LHSFASSPTNLYVSPSGSDSNDGSAGSPFRSIQKGADSAGPGTTVHVASGSYSPVTINSSGTASAPLTIVADAKWGAKITGSGNGSTKSYLVRNNASYVRFIGFDLSSSGVTDGIDNFGAHNLIQGNHIHDMTNINCSGSPGGAALGDDAGSNNTYDGNVVNNIGGYPTACDYVHAIYVDDDGDIVSNNIAYNNAGNGLYTNHGTGRVIFTNNISFANKEYGVGVNGTGSGNIVQNNILIGNGIAGIKTWSGTSNTQILHNIFYNNATNTILSGSSTQSSNSTADPGLVNYQSNGSGDYHLRSTSIALDAGVNTYAPGIDFDGHTRPQGKTFDIGPYEYTVASSPAPSPSPTPSPSPSPSPSPTPTPTPAPTSGSSSQGSGSTATPSPTPATGSSSQTPSSQNTTGTSQSTTSTPGNSNTTTTIASNQGETYSPATAQAATASSSGIQNFAATALPLCQKGQSLGHNTCTCTNQDGNSTAAICSTARIANPVIAAVTVLVVLILSIRIVQAVRLFQTLSGNGQYTPMLRRRVILSALGVIGSVLIYAVLAFLIPGGLLNK
jgi:hypothetical protein